MGETGGSRRVFPALAGYSPSPSFAALSPSRANYGEAAPKPSSAKTRDDGVGGPRYDLCGGSRRLKRKAFMNGSRWPSITRSTSPISCFVR